METTLKTETVPLNELVPYWRNPRKNDKAVDAVVESIKRYGYCNPIAIDTEGVIISGHTRYRALLQLGADQATVVRLDLPPEKAKNHRS